MCICINRHTYLLFMHVYVSTHHTYLLLIHIVITVSLLTIDRSENFLIKLVLSIKLLSYNIILYLLLFCKNDAIALINLSSDTSVRYFLLNEEKILWKNRRLCSNLLPLQNTKEDG